MEEKTIVRQTEFNSAAATLQRIHYAFMTYTQAKIQQDYLLCKETLDRLWAEVEVFLGDMPNLFRQELSEVRIRTEKALSNYRYAQKLSTDVIGRDSISYTTLIKVEYHLRGQLEHYEILLRRILNKKKMLMTEKSSALEAAYEE